MKDLNAFIQEKGNKGSKFKTAALKARKELETVREKYKSDTTTFEEQIASLEQKVDEGRDEYNSVQEELQRQKTECSKHEEEFEV